MNIGSCVAALVAGSCCAVASAQSVTPTTASRDVFVEAFVVDSNSYSSGYDSDSSHSDTLTPFKRTLNRFLKLGLQSTTTFSSQESSISSSGVTALLTIDETSVAPSPGMALAHSKGLLNCDFQVTAPSRARITVTLSTLADGVGTTTVSDFGITGPKGSVATLAQSATGQATLTRTVLLSPGSYKVKSTVDTTTQTPKGTVVKHGRATAAIDVKFFCAADFDMTGFVDTDDFTAFTNAFESGAESADVDQSGFVDTDDFTAFMAVFSNPC